MRLGTEADADTVAALEPGPGRRRHGRKARMSRTSRSREPRPCRPGTSSRDRLPTGRRAVVADWGGDASGLASAELLARAGNDVALAVGSAALGEALHQYQRNLYAQRLYRAGVEIRHHLDLVAADARRGRASATSSPASWRPTLPADLLVLALGRVPERGLAEELTARGLPRRGGRRLPQPAQRGGGGARRYSRGRRLGSLRSARDPDGSRAARGHPRAERARCRVPGARGLPARAARGRGRPDRPRVGLGAAPQVVGRRASGC